MPDLIWHPGFYAVALLKRNRKSSLMSSAKHAMYVYDERRWMPDQVRHDGIEGLHINTKYLLAIRFDFAASWTVTSTSSNEPQHRHARLDLASSVVTGCRAGYNVDGLCKLVEIGTL
ncbi:hypothetical protein [Undibacterium sp. YM2]|uniref:hypothetical protein n=1 Tax=Undibacterium sp. YM2 TaxID=2058625 RepID=UPI0013898B16|nr:hypothetical protein [Undibacterium sp. YM2]